MDKYIDAGGIAIIGESTLENEDLLIASQITLQMTEKQPEIREYLSTKNGFYITLYDVANRPGVIGLPETDKWVSEIRGVIAMPWAGLCYFSGNGRHTFACTAPAGKTVNVREYRPQKKCDSLWCRYDLRKADWNIFIHEMGHAIEFIANNIDGRFDRWLTQIYDNAVINELIFDGFHGKNKHEYWAVGVEYWFYQHRDLHFEEGVEVPRSSRDQLKLRDPELHNLLSHWFADTEIIRF